MNKTNLKGLTIPELEEFFISIGEKKFRGQQAFSWLYSKKADSFDDITVFSAPLRAKLAEVAEIGKLEIVDAQTSHTDETTKFLFRLHDGNHVEAVLIPSESRDDEEHPKRQTLCISTQVGCPLDCQFCATASMKVKRNLTTFEILDQFLQVQKRVPHRLTNIVYMGMGEPMLNYENVMKSVEIFAHEEANLVSASHITISTAGIVDGILRMAEEKRKVKLAISLHTLDDELRS
ncbi:MAG TPA: 23S rRNA (adenine(2503)-C(2))-methyltransferase RlmN, partial [Candidatus Kapabacteria bacterium]|nr:23S rRNA (adenine(2503)-C(2))-methyltransferase RlmN [Candidatus Kapabacteria bacterium]